MVQVAGDGTGKVGSDVISVKMLYKPATFTPIGPAQVLDSTVDPDFIDTRNRRDPAASAARQAHCGIR